MLFTKKTVLRFIKDTRALESSEFAVMLAAIVVVVYGAFQLLGGRETETGNLRRRSL